ADHEGKLIGFTFETELFASHLFVMLKLHLEKSHEVHCNTCSTGNSDSRMGIGGENLVHLAMSNRHSCRCATIAGHNYAVGESHCDHCRGVRKSVRVEHRTSSI